MTGQDLESRYRRLLVVYPWEHRRVYEDEMLAVLLAGARPGQRRPSVGDVANLVVAGLRVRVGGTLRGFTEPAWSDGAAVTGLLAALALLALAGRAVADGWDSPWPGPGFARDTDLAEWLRVAGWTAVSAAVLAGLRWPAIGLAWAGVAAEATLLSLRYGDRPVPAVQALWQFALVVVAAAALTVPAPRRRALAVLGARRILVISLALAAVVGIFLANRLTRPSYESGPTTVYVLYDLEARSEALIWLYVAGFAAAGLALLVAVATIAPPVRRRIMVLLAPVVALVVLVDLTLAGWAVSNDHMGHAIYLVPVQWAALIGVPVLAFAVGVLLVRRREQTLHLVALGRAAARQPPAT